MSKRYTMTIYVAAPGTPLYADNGEGGYRDSGKTSTPGHMYYAISDGASRYGYGFGPRTDGDLNGPGVVRTDDERRYHQPHYARTLEITRDQFESARLYGDLASRGRNPDFSPQYQDVRNNCVDFVWGAMHAAGIYRGQRTIDLPGERFDLPIKRFEGSLKPMDNIDDVRDIRAPFPDSSLNREQVNPLPPRGVLQRTLSVEDLQDPDHPLHAGYSAIRRDVGAWEARIGKSRDGHTENLELSLLRDATVHRISPEWVMPSIANEHVRAGQNVFVGQGDPGAHPRRYVHLDTQTAIATPASESLQRIELALAGGMGERQQVAAPAQSPVPDETQRAAARSV